MGVISQSDDNKIYAICSATQTKVLLMVDHTCAQIRDNEARAILKTIHNLYVDVTANNPFYVHGTTLNSRYVLLHFVIVILSHVFCQIFKPKVG